MCFDSPIKHNFTFTPAVSLFVECADEAGLDAAFARLAQGGQLRRVLAAQLLLAASHGGVRITEPDVRPASTSRCASAARSSGNVAPTSMRSAPLRTRSNSSSHAAARVSGVFAYQLKPGRCSAMHPLSPSSRTLKGGTGPEALP